MLKELWKKSDRNLTIWVMEDLTSEPRQFQIHTRVIRNVVTGLIATLAVLFLLVAGLSLWSSQMRSKNAQLEIIADRYQCSDQKLIALAGKMNELEARADSAYEGARGVMDKIAGDLGAWSPGGSVGGGPERSAETQARPNNILTGAQYEKITALERRMRELDRQLAAHERALKQIEGAWSERKFLFSSLPTVWPVANGRITSYFGMRVHPISQQLQMHKGLDIAAPLGTPIHASAAGRVVRAGQVSGYGNLVEISHGYGISTLYGHLSQILVQSGQKVKAGDLIGKVGNTGASTGPHLHFEVQVFGQPVNPLEYLSRYSRPPSP